MLRFLFWVLILSWGVALLRRAVAWMLGGGTTDAQQGSGSAQNSLPTRRLVRDPVCGVHVAEELAIPLNEDGVVVHFCSTECRDKYAGSVRKFAANG